MQDITPSEDPRPVPPRREPSSPPPPPPAASTVAPERSIRDFRPSAERVRLGTPLRSPERAEASPRISRGKKRWGIWIAAAVLLLVLAGAGALVLFPSVTVTVTPRTHVMPFDASMPLTAYPAGGAATGTIPYTVMSQSFEDSAVVEASGTEQAEEKATGNITVYNEYSDQPVALIKNTRFQTPDGLIFRIPASVDVPGKTAAGPGTITVSVFADQTGPSYNVGPIDKFTIPGLKSSAEMYEKVYAKSTAAFTGGFSGQRPAVSPSVLEAARAEVRNRLTERAREYTRTTPDNALALPGLSAVAFESLPPTNEPGGGVRINEKATVTMPVFPAADFARSVAQAVSADAEGQSVAITFSDDSMAQPVGTIDVADLGQKPITFTLAGRGQLAWNVDTESLAGALAGREESAFETVVGSFPAIEEAHARLMPFWKQSFPADPSKITITVESPPPQF